MVYTVLRPWVFNLLLRRMVEMLQKLNLNLLYFSRSFQFLKKCVDRNLLHHAGYYVGYSKYLRYMYVW